MKNLTVGTKVTIFNPAGSCNTAHWVETEVSSIASNKEDFSTINGVAWIDAITGQECWEDFSISSHKKMWYFADEPLPTLEEQQKLFIKYLQD